MQARSLFLLAALFAARPGQPCARVRHQSGPATLIRHGAAFPLRPGATLYPGDVIHSARSTVTLFTAHEPAYEIHPGSLHLVTLTRLPGRPLHRPSAVLAIRG